MTEQIIGVLCLQETHQLKSDYYVSDEGYLVILSGSAAGIRERAGVGFIVAPGWRRSVVGFCQATARMASLKLRVSGGKAVLVSAYVPHSGYNFAERQSFYHDLSEFAAKLSSHGPKIIFGDFNARLYRRMPGEEHIIGPNVFNNAEAIVKDDMNRHLLIELCTSLDTVVANTFFETPDTEQVTCYNVGSKPKDAVQWKSHSQIDFASCDLP